MALIVAAMLAIGAEAAANPQQPARAPIRVALPFEKFTLPNGLTVIVHEDRRAAVVSIRLAFRAGARDDPANRRGMSRLVRWFLAEGATRHMTITERPNLLWTMG